MSGLGPAQTNFLGGSLGGALNKRSVASVKDKKQPAKVSESTEPESTAKSVDTSASQVPQGTSAEVLTWVGDDKSRAQDALDAENETDKPRSTVVRELKKVLESE